MRKCRDKRRHDSQRPQRGCRPRCRRTPAEGLPDSCGGFGAPGRYLGDASRARPRGQRRGRSIAPVGGAAEADDVHRRGRPACRRPVAAVGPARSSTTMPAQNAARSSGRPGRCCCCSSASAAAGRQANQDRLPDSSGRPGRATSRPGAGLARPAALHQRHRPARRGRRPRPAHLVAQDSVTAVDAATGATRWRSSPTARSASPRPSGATALRRLRRRPPVLPDLATASVLWKFRGGPADRHILGNERLISHLAGPRRAGRRQDGDGRRSTSPPASGRSWASSSTPSTPAPARCAGPTTATARST